MPSLRTQFNPEQLPACVRSLRAGGPTVPPVTPDVSVPHPGAQASESRERLPDGSAWGHETGPEPHIPGLVPWLVARQASRTAACQRCDVTHCTLERTAMPPSAHGKLRSSPRPSSLVAVCSRSLLSPWAHVVSGGQLSPGHRPRRAHISRSTSPTATGSQHRPPGLVPHGHQVCNRATRRRLCATEPHTGPGSSQCSEGTPRSGQGRPFLRSKTRPGTCPCPDDPQAFTRELDGTAHQALPAGSPKFRRQVPLRGTHSPRAPVKPTSDRSTHSPLLRGPQWT